MQTVWRFGGLAVTGEEIDFEDPAEHGPEVRERGLRVELRVATTSARGSIYASPEWALGPAFCRVDLLESRPGARDRMHWHPAMSDGEPGDRTFDPDIPRDPAGWLTALLHDAPALLRDAGIAGDHRSDVEELRGGLGPVRQWLDRGLERMTEPWPAVVHGADGLAAT